MTATATLETRADVLAPALLCIAASLEAEQARAFDALGRRLAELLEGREAGKVIELSARAA